jgi:hypothetical protein
MDEQRCDQCEHRRESGSIRPHPFCQVRRGRPNIRHIGDSQTCEQYKEVPASQEQE